MRHCKRCEAPIRWATTGTGLPIPVNAHPDPQAGNLRLSHELGGDIVVQMLVWRDAEAARGAGEQLHVAHFTCPDKEPA